MEDKGREGGGNWLSSKGGQWWQQAQQMEQGADRAVVVVGSSKPSATSTRRCCTLPCGRTSKQGCHSISCRSNEQRMTLAGCAVTSRHTTPLLCKHPFSSVTTLWPLPFVAQAIPNPPSMAQAHCTPVCLLLCSRGRRVQQEGRSCGAAAAADTAAARCSGPWTHSRAQHSHRAVAATY